MINISDRRCKENKNVHLMFNKFVSKNCAVYEIMWKNIVQQSGSQMKIVQQMKGVICMQDK
jgi:hypothetical protein